MANSEQIAIIQTGTGNWNNFRSAHPDVSVDLSGADLCKAKLRGADLRGADFRGAQLAGTNLRVARLAGADISNADLIEADLRGADLRLADLSGSRLRWANLLEANLDGARAIKTNFGQAKMIRSNLANCILNHSTFLKADLSGANLQLADISDTDFRSASLQYSDLSGAIAENIKLWEAQRAGWIIRNIKCSQAYWDTTAERSDTYSPGEFEKLYAQKSNIELSYKGGVSIFDLSTLPSLLQHLKSLHPNENVKLKSIEDTGGGTKILLDVDNSNVKTLEAITADAMEGLRARLMHREDQVMRLEIEKRYLENLVFGQGLPSSQLKGSPTNVYHVSGTVITGENPSVVVNQVIELERKMLTIVDRMILNRTDLALAPLSADALGTQLSIAKEELQKKEPDKTVVEKSITLIAGLGKEALTKAAGKVGEAAVTNWQTWIHELSQHLHHWL